MYTSGCPFCFFLKSSQVFGQEGGELLKMCCLRRQKKRCCPPYLVTCVRSFPLPTLGAIGVGGFFAFWGAKKHPYHRGMRLWWVYEGLGVDCRRSILRKHIELGCTKAKGQRSLYTRMYRHSIYTRMYALGRNWQRKEPDWYNSSRLTLFELLGVSLLNW